MNEVLTLIKSLDIKNDEALVVACSGGPDSMYLLHLLSTLGYKVVCAHVNHKYRKESDQEYIFVKEYCESLNIIFEGVELDGYSTGNFELYARNFRYSFFAEIIKKYHARYLFTAHHGDDLIETILMRITRGSSLKGYSGFSTKTIRDDYTIVRPLVYLTKDDILEYNDENKIPYVHDYTNDLDDYTRNRFRHKVLPFLKEEDAIVHLRFLKFSNDLKETNAFIERLVNEFLDKNYIDNVLSIKTFKNLDPYLQRQVINQIFVRLYPDNLYLVNGNHIDEVIKIIYSNKPNIELVFPDNIIFTKEYDNIIIKKGKNNIKGYEYVLENQVDTPLGKISKVESSDDSSNYVIRLNSKDITLPLIVRTRKDNDNMVIKNMTGHKKINDIFIDSKIPKSKRDEYPIVCDSKGIIIWLPGLKKSNLDIPNKNVYDIILKYEKGEIIDE